MQYLLPFRRYSFQIVCAFCVSGPEYPCLSIFNLVDQVTFLQFSLIRLVIQLINSPSQFTLNPLKVWPQPTSQMSPNSTRIHPCGIRPLFPFTRLIVLWVSESLCSHTQRPVVVIQHNDGPRKQNSWDRIKEYIIYSI